MLSSNTRSFSFSPLEEAAQSKRKNNRDTSDPTYSFVHLTTRNSNVENGQGSSTAETTPSDLFSNVSRSIWKYFCDSHQSPECYQKKVELKEALRHMFNEIFPCKSVPPCLVLMLCNCNAVSFQSWAFILWARAPTGSEQMARIWTFASWSLTKR